MTSDRITTGSIIHRRVKDFTGVTWHLCFGTFDFSRHSICVPSNQGGAWKVQHGVEDSNHTPSTATRQTTTAERNI